MIEFKPGSSRLLFFMSEDVDFWVQYLSVHYPFTEEQVVKYWDVLEPGTAYYTTHLSDSDWCYTSTPGLCFNQNIRWTDALRSRWKVGLDDPYNGYVVGVGDAPVEYDNRDLWRKIIPLNLNKEGDARLMASIGSNKADSMEDWGEYQVLEAGDKGLFSHEYSRLTITEVEALYRKNYLTLLFKRSIWFNTMYYEIPYDMVIQLLMLKRYRRII